MNIRSSIAILSLAALGDLLNGCSSQPYTFPTINIVNAAAAEDGATIEQNKGGFGAYAAMHPKWPCALMMQGYNQAAVLRLSVLWNTFGNDFRCLDRFASDPRPKILQVHLINEVCQRNKRCGQYEILAGMTVDQYNAKLLKKNPDLLSKITAHVTPVAQYFENNPSVQCLLTAGLESNLSSRAYRILVDQLKPIFPARCKWGWNPVGQNAYGARPIKDFYFEAHGDSPKGVKAPCVVNLDGVDLDLKARPAILPLKAHVSELPRFLASFASCDVAFFWIAEFNGIERGGFIDPRKRDQFPDARIMVELGKFLLAPVAKWQVPPWSAEDEKGKIGCGKMLRPHDGEKKDFLWKQSTPPVLNRGAVVFLPRKFNAISLPTPKVYVMKGSRKVAVSYEKGRYTEDKSDRQFFRFRKLAKDFPYNVVVHFDKLCVAISNPKTRID